MSASTRIYGHLQDQETNADVVRYYLSDLADISKKHGIGLTGKATLFLMEQDDYSRVYRIDETSRLFFM